MIVVFLSLIYFTVAVPTIVIALLVEVNSVFLHGRQIYIMSGFDKTTLLFKAFTATNIASFVVFRFGVIRYLSTFMYDQWFLLPLLVRWTMPTVMATMLVINGILFWRLLKSDVFARSKGEGHEILVSNDVSSWAPKGSLNGSSWNLIFRNSENFEFWFRCMPQGFTSS